MTLSILLTFGEEPGTQGRDRHIGRQGSAGDIGVLNGLRSSEFTLTLSLVTYMHVPVFCMYQILHKNYLTSLARSDPIKMGVFCKFLSKDLFALSQVFTRSWLLTPNK